jgi:hypothetical protein
MPFAFSPELEAALSFASFYNDLFVDGAPMIIDPNLVFTYEFNYSYAEFIRNLVQTGDVS